MSQPTRQEIAEAVLELSDKKSESALAEAVARYLVHERRSHELDAIMREVAKQRRAKTGLVEVTLTSAFPLSKSVKNELVKILEANKTIVNEVTDDDVLGGVRMETSEKLLDLSVRNRLQKLKEGVINE